MSTPALYLRSATKYVVQYSTFLSFLFLLGCFDLNDSDTNNTELLKNSYSDTIIEGQATNSVIKKGIVQSYQIVHSEETSTTSTEPFGLPVRTDENGHFNFRLPNDIQSRSILLKITADKATKMTCDIVSGCLVKSTKERIEFGNTFLLDDQFELTAILPELAHGFTNTVTINPLTHLASSLAQSKETGATIENIESSNHYIENLFGLQEETLQLPTPDLTKLDDYVDINQFAMKTAVLSTSFLALLNSPDWNSVGEIIQHAANRISTSGTVTAANMGALPEVSLDDLFYQADEIVQGLLTQTNNAAKQNTLNKISLEVKKSYELTMIAPEIINTVEIEKHPTSITVQAGLASKLRVVSLGDNLSYQWRLNNKPIIGANEAIYNINNTSIENAGTYDVIVSNILGSQITLSALLTVIPIREEQESQQLSNEQTTDNTNAQTTSSNEQTSDASIAQTTNDSNEQTPNNSIAQTTSSRNAQITTNDTAPIENTPPIAQDDAVEIFEDTATNIYVLNNDSDIDNDRLIITHATITNGPGKVSIQKFMTNTGLYSSALFFTPEKDSNLSSTISYTIGDSHRNESNALVNVKILPINDTPKSFPDTADMDEDTSLTLNVLANDYDADHDSLTLTSASSASGAVKLNPDNTITFQPLNNFNGIAEINYIMTDGHGGITAGIATITVNNVNDNPVATNDTAETSEDTAVVINALNNDSDEDHDALKITHASTSSGQVSINADNTLTYTPLDNIHGSEILNYTISDENGGTSSAAIYVSILATNDAPVLANDMAQTNEDTPIIINILANDSDADNDSLTVTDATVISPGAMASINRDNTLTVVPVNNFNGEVNLSYTVNDGHGSIAKASVTVIVNAINDLPTLADHQASTEQSVEVKIDALVGAYDLDGDTLKIVTSTALNGVTTLDEGQVITYQPATNFSGEDIISYSVSDGKGGVANAMISVYVSAVEKLASVELNWELPTKKDDGTPLYLSDVKGYAIAYGINSNQLDSSVFVSSARSTHHTINNLNSGTHYFAIATVSQDNIQGAYSEKIAVSITQ